MKLPDPLINYVRKLLKRERAKPKRQEPTRELVRAWEFYREYYPDDTLIVRKKDEGDD